MFFYEWLVPLLMAVALVVWLLFAAVKNKSGAGIRTEGRTVIDKPVDEEDPHSPS